jgi:hypothetical protein
MFKMMTRSRSQANMSDSDHHRLTQDAYTLTHKIMLETTWSRYKGHYERFIIEIYLGVKPSTYTYRLGQSAYRLKNKPEDLLKFCWYLVAKHRR